MLHHIKFFFVCNSLHIVFGRGSRKKSSLTSGPTTKRGVGGKGQTTKEKILSEALKTKTK